MLSCKKIYKSYNNTNPNLNIVIDNVDLTIEQGELIALRGPSGSGKTTLLNAISGLDRVTSGDIIFENNNLTTMSNDELSSFRSKNIGIIFQFFNLLNDLTVMENISMPLLLRGIDKKVIHHKALKLVKELGLEERINYKTNILSGGESQKVAIARSLIAQPKIILADEPTGNLDTENTEKIIELLINSCKESNSSLLIVSHDENIIKHFDIVYELNSGKLSN
jgi:ABC-type lipoprotein export system ATPase subunit